MEIGEELNDVEIITSALNSLGNAYSDNKQYDLASKTFDEMIVILKKNNLKHMLLYAIGNRSEIYFNLGKYELFEKEGNKLLLLASEQKNIVFTAQSYMMLSIIDAINEKFKLSKINAYRAMYAVENIDSFLITLWVIFYTSFAFLLEGDIEKGLSWIGYLSNQEKIDRFILTEIEDKRKQLVPNISDKVWDSGLKNGEGLKIDDLIDEILSWKDLQEN